MRDRNCDEHSLGGPPERELTDLLSCCDEFVDIVALESFLFDALTRLLANEESMLDDTAIHGVSLAIRTIQYRQGRLKAALYRLAQEVGL